jgi:hypothetical protein
MDGVDGFRVEFNRLVGQMAPGGNFISSNELSVMITLSNDSFDHYKPSCGRIMIIHDTFCQSGQFYDLDTTNCINSCSSNQFLYPHNDTCSSTCSSPYFNLQGTPNCIPNCSLYSFQNSYSTPKICHQSNQCDLLTIPNTKECLPQCPSSLFNVVDLK